MLTLAHDITIGNYKVKHLLFCEVRKSANKLMDTATIKLNGMAYGVAQEIENKIKRGDEVIIKLGYAEQGELPTEFKGFVSIIQTDNTIEITCEDGMFLFRKDVENKQYKDINVPELVKKIASQIGGFEVVSHDGVSDVKYDKFTVNDATGLEVLRKIAEENKLHIFVKGKKLHVALKFTYKSGEVKFDFTKNIEKSNLKYLKSEDKKVLVEVVGIMRDNTKKMVLVGDKGGDKITIHRYNVSDEKSLKAIGNEELKNYRYTGYEGNITTWLLPYCTYGYSASIKDEDYPLREGKYYVEAVTTTFSKIGGVKKVNLSIKL